MNKKDLNEIRRRFQVDRNNISRLQGCYVNSQGEAVSVFADTLIGMPKEEAEKYLALFKKALSGTEDQNLRNIDFDPERMADSEAYHLLCSMKDTALKDDEVVNEFFRRVMAATPLNEPYLILLAHDGYDIPYRHSDGHPAQDAPTEIFHYIVGCICPVKMTKPALCYDAGENIFRSKEADWVVNAPEIGFMFPAFESRSVNVCRALYYTRDTASNHEELTGALFDASLSMPAAAQKEAFQQIMQDTLGDECSYEVMQAVHEQVMEKIEERKAEKNPEPVRVNRYDMTRRSRPPLPSNSGSASVKRPTWPPRISSVPSSSRCARPACRFALRPSAAIWSKPGRSTGIPTSSFVRTRDRSRSTV